jgi:hypothetical protein
MWRFLWTAGATAVFAIMAAMPMPAARAGDVRHLTIPKVSWGTWALNKDFCSSNDKSNLIIKEGGGSGPQENCAVQYVVETAGQNGPIYSAHMLCTDKSDPAKKTNMAFIVVPRGDDVMAVGTDFGDLKTYYRCPVTN